ncbi:hypothetical protein [Streptomyces decoyicus]|uniref:hypothetical protein n=1 Tax=Streptomyces decoyicus TaxID=249567 RepID=UPI003659C587
MDIPWSSLVAGTTATFSAIATYGAWMAARRANATADAVARIERDRWHADLTPSFTITIERTSDRTATLSVHLAGPLPLQRLDEIHIRVVPSDDADRTSRLPNGPSQEDLNAQVWGPYRFTHGADGADINGQTVAPFSLRVGAGRPFSVEKTWPPRWIRGDSTAQQWTDQWLNMPVRLILTCIREGFNQWTVPYEVEVPQAPRVRHL